MPVELESVLLTVRRCFPFAVVVCVRQMYNYSLDAFITFFLKAMSRAKAAETTKERVVTLRESIRITVFTWVNRGLFEKHKLIFSSQLCFKLMQKGALKELFKWCGTHTHNTAAELERRQGR